MAPSSDAAAFRAAFASSKSIIILAGAGLSAGSGLQTFKGAGGLWNGHIIEEVASTQGFKDHPGRVWQFYHQRRVEALKAEPNAAHRTLAALSIPSNLARLAPSLDATSSPPLLITQNTDSLSRRALDELPPDVKAAAAERLLEMHGSLMVTRCLSCQHVNRSSAPLFNESQISEDGEIDVSALPRCGGPAWAGSNRYGNCGGMLRPSVVWFGEVPEHQGEIARRLNWCDMLLVVGTSALVHPAAGFAATVRKRGGKVAVFNLERTKDDEEADFLFLGRCEETLPQTLKI